MQALFLGSYGRVGNGGQRGCAGQNNVLDGVQSARLEGLTRLARASRVKVRDNERKKDSDRAALEEE
jgi:hypothetical protein